MILNRSKLFVALLTLAPLSTLSLQCQEKPTAPKDVAQNTSLVRQLTSYEVLEHARRLGDESRGLDSKEEEIRYQSKLADEVWRWDQPLGRRLLLRSFDLTVELTKEASSLTGSSANTTDPNLLFREVTAIAARHDAKLERQLEESWQIALTSISNKEGSSFSRNSSQLSDLLLKQSADNLRKDEQKSRSLFKQSVSLRVLQDHCFYLMSQRKRSPEVTDMLFNDTLDVLSKRSLYEANEILLLSSYLFSPNDSITYSLIDGYNAANVGGNVSALPRNSALAKRYLALVLAQLNPGDAVPAGVVFFALKTLLPQYQVYAPELLNDVYAKTGSLGPNVSKEDSITYEMNHKALSTSEADGIDSWETRLRNTDKVDDESRRDLGYFTIINGYLLPKKDFTRALLVANRVGDQELKQKLSDFVILGSLQASIERADAAPLLSEDEYNKIKDPLLSTIALGSFAQFRIKQKATGEAIRLLDRAVVKARDINNDQDRLQAKLMITQLYLAADASAGFNAATTTFKEINKLPDFNMRRSEFSLKFKVYGFPADLFVPAPIGSSLFSTARKMCGINCQETFQVCLLLENRRTRLWTTLEVVQIALEGLKGSDGLHTGRGAD